jgi:multidrug efflux pump subunit AcrA (membrane-fusion protein)
LINKRIDTDTSIEAHDSISENEVISEEISDIISAVPRWIVRWGITLVLAILSSIIIASALINYPDVVKTSLKVNSLNSPKVVSAHQNGKLISLLVQEGQVVKKDQALAYLESAGNPDDVLKLEAVLKDYQAKLDKRLNTGDEQLPDNLNLGELQGAYQSFYVAYLQYKATEKKGYYSKRREFLKKDLYDITNLRSQIINQKQVQQLEYANEEREYNAYQKLYGKKVISRSEFVLQENKYLSSKYPLQQTETSLLNNANTYSAKEKELLDLEHTIAEQQSEFLQALNQCITEANKWILLYIMKAPVDGSVNFAGIIQQNQNVVVNQEVFVINPGNTDFFGEVRIPQYNMGKVRLGARTLVKLHSYPYEQYGVVQGKLTYVSDVAYRDSVFIAKVSLDDFEQKKGNGKIILKTGMLADAEIITEESSLLMRFVRNLTKILK